jgi:hypothetical protein
MRGHGLRDVGDLVMLEATFLTGANGFGDAKTEGPGRTCAVGRSSTACSTFSCPNRIAAGHPLPIIHA